MPLTCTLKIWLTIKCYVYFTTMKISQEYIPNEKEVNLHSSICKIKKKLSEWIFKNLSTCLQDSGKLNQMKYEIIQES